MAPQGDTTTGSLAESLPTIRHSARMRAEFPMVMPKTSERHMLDPNTGLDWTEITVEQLTAQAITESTILDNPQQLIDALFSITPTMTGIQTFISERTERRISSNVAALLGRGAQVAVERKKDEDGLTILDTASTSLAGAGSTLTNGHVSAGVSQSRYNNGVEPLTGRVNIVLQSFQLKDIQDEVVSGIGTYPIPTGLSQEAFHQGLQGMLFGGMVFVDDNITIDSNDDAKGGIFEASAILLIDGMAVKTKTRDRPDKAGGGQDLFITAEYAYGIRHARGVYEVFSDAFAPTS